MEQRNRTWAGRYARPLSVIASVTPSVVQKIRAIMARLPSEAAEHLHLEPIQLAEPEQDTGRFAVGEVRAERPGLSPPTPPMQAFAS